MGKYPGKAADAVDEPVKPTYEVRIWPEDGWWLARVMAAKWVCITHLKANWKSILGGRLAAIIFLRYLA